MVTKVDERKTLRQWRAYLALTQEDLAVLVNVHVNTVQNWEAGRAYPSARLRRRIARLLRVEPGNIEWPVPHGGQA